MSILDIFTRCEYYKTCKNYTKTHQTCQFNNIECGIYKHIKHGEHPAIGE